MKTFLEDLKNELVKMQVSEDKIKEIISDMEEMITSAKEEGISDEELKAKLGNPQKLALDLAEIEPKEEKPYDETEKDTVYAFDPIGDHVSILTKLLNDDITYTSVDSTLIRVIIKNRKHDQKFNISYENQLLKIDTGMRKTMFFGFSFGHDASSVFIEIPKTLNIHEIKNSVVNGDVLVQSLVCLSLNFNATEGDLEIRDVHFQDGHIHTVNGDVEMTKTKAKMLHVNTVSGDVKLEHTQIEQDLTISTVSGDFEAKESQTDNLYFHTISGDGDGKEFYIKKLSFDSISGDFTLHNSRKEPIEILRKKSLSGDINI